MIDQENPRFLLFSKYTQRPFLLTILLIIATTLFYNKEVKNAIKHLKNEEKSKLLLQVNEIKNDFVYVQRDVLLLADLISTSSYTSCENGKSLISLRTEITQYLKRKKIYDQIRILDTNGVEILRCEYNREHPKFTPDSLLQDKSNRYYFKEISKLKNEDIYFSKFDLNIENGMIEKPYKQILRVGSKIYGCDKRYVGILIVNYLGNPLVKRIEELNQQQLGDFYLVDNDGFYIMSPNQEDNWGFMFPAKLDKTFSNHHPFSWETINHQNSGQTETKDGIFTFFTLNFKQIVDKHENDFIPFFSSNEYWKIISYVSSDKIAALKAQIRSHFYIPIFFLFALIILLTRVYIYAKEKEQKAKEEIQKLASVVKNSNNCILITDTQARVEWINPALEKLLGKPLSTIKGQDFRRHFVNRKNSRATLEKLNNIIKNKRSGKVELLNYFQENIENWQSTQIKLINTVQKHEDEKIIFVGTDVTDLKNKEKEITQLNNNLEEIVKNRTLELRESLEREKKLNKIKSNFISMASHELRTPLGIILSSANLAERYSENHQEDKREKHFNRIRTSVQDLVETLNFFLNSGKLENDIEDSENNTFNLENFLNDLLKQFEEILKKDQNINFIHKDVEHIVTNKKILKNIMLNLMSNAIKYSEKDIMLLVEEIDGKISIKVQDHGIGVPKAQQNKIFSKFFRAENTENIQGTGLGLNIVKHYVELINGTISFVSEENVGTTFTILLPKNRLMVDDHKPEI